ncbi:MAG: hypothetical protein MJ082_01175 [Clostridia bacterium]|nr:hypothetical protein [Clostridia bacterium]
MTEFKFAVAVLKGDEEIIMGLFDTKAEADAFGMRHPVAHSEGLQYCFASNFMQGKPCGEEMSIYNYYNVPTCA